MLLQFVPMERHRLKPLRLGKELQIELGISYLFITHGSYDGQKATPLETKKIRKDLEKYCGQDTEGMIWILDKLNCHHLCSSHVFSTL